jgi:hypothetical protein
VFVPTLSAIDPDASLKKPVQALRVITDAGVAVFRTVPECWRLA